MGEYLKKCSKTRQEMEAKLMGPRAGSIAAVFKAPLEYNGPSVGTAKQAGRNQNHSFDLFYIMKNR